MLIYDLQCVHSHIFEGWFSSASDLQNQLEQGMICCPICDDKKIQKIPAASKITRHSSSLMSVNKDGQKKALVYKKHQEFFREVHDHIEKNYEDVGTKFADRALKMHKGEIEHRSIRGSATREEVHELNKEGVEILPIPKKPPEKNQLN